MKSAFATLLVLVALTAAPPAEGALNVLACEPEWAALVEELAGDHAKTYSATTAMRWGSCIAVVAE